MKKSSLITYILLTLVASTIWLAGSWWHYACNIKNTCKTPAELASNTLNNEKPPIDTDGDGLSDSEESRLGTDPLLMDTDQDSISDSQEIGVDLDSPLDSDEDNLIDALDADDDNDGLATAAEEQVGTSSLLADTDEDGILDSVEVGDDISAPLDTDGDGIINALDTDDDDDGIETVQEFLLGTNHLLTDSDGDGLADGDEIADLMDEPLDSDKNGILDPVDTDPTLDQDNDGLTDLVEAKLNTDPKKADSDGDGINDAIEIGKNTDEPIDSDLDGIIDALDSVDDSDSDNDGITDTLELKLKSNPKLADSDNDGINDLEELGKNIDQPLDTDNDGTLNLIDSDDDNDNLSTRYETRIGTNPLDSDSDKDGLADNIEAKAPGSDKLQDTDNDKVINPLDTDDDNDTIPTANELALGTNHLKTDSDGDGISDAIEVGQDFEAAKDTDKDGIIDALDTTVDEIASAPTTDSAVSSQIKPDSSDNATGDKILNSSINSTDQKTETMGSKEADSKAISLELTGAVLEDSIQPSVLYFPHFTAEPVVKQDAKNYLDEIASWMKKDENNKVNLTGHTDSVGSKQSNLALGIRRVMVIRELLINRGSPMSQIEVMSRGESQPLASNKTEAGRFKNRRVAVEPIKFKLK